MGAIACTVQMRANGNSVRFALPHPSHAQATFLLADADRSGGLSPEEHFAFNHPEDADNPVLHAHLQKQDVLDRDHDKDGK